ncbi:hypothetical protein PIB30_031827 [Stylosanthes scabra]|uniref:Uncharacterized protein n=1 Tax=Stylosanthes scabra TaxID=79078 RepID=A0ABU6RC53_9FABA|nr:hypothetical protein [Stylosanthes scabra]
MEMQNQIAIRLNQIAEMLQKSTSQQIQLQPQAPIPNPLPPQPLSNPKGFLNAIHDDVGSEDESEDTDNEEAEQHLYELLLKMAESKGGMDANNEELMDFCEEYDSDYEEDESDQERETEDKWKKETQNLGPLKKSKEVFSTADTSIMSIAGIADNVLVKIGKLTIPADFHILKPTPKEKKGKPQVLLGRPFLKTGGFKQNYHDDTFKFSAEKTTERFQIIKKGKDHSLQKDDGRMRSKESAQTEMIEALAKRWVKMLKEDLEESCCAEQKSQKKGPDKINEKPLAEYPSVTRMLNKIEKILYHDKGADAHLMAPRKDKAPQMPTRFSKRLAALKARQTRDEAGPSNAAPRYDEIINISSDSEQVQENVQEEGGEIEEEEVPGEGALLEVLQPLAQEEPEDISYDGPLHDPKDEEMEEEEEDPE